MADNTNGRGYPEPRFDQFVSKATSRRQFIKGVIFSGAAASGAGYLLSIGGCSGEQGSAAGVERLLTLNVNGQMRPVDVLPNETLAMTLRYKLGADGHEARLRSRRVRRLHGARRRRRELLVLDADARRARPRDHDDRRARRAERRAAQGAASDDRRARPAVRFLHAGADHVGRRVAQREPDADARRGATRACRATSAAAAPTTTT